MGWFINLLSNESVARTVILLAFAGAAGTAFQQVAAQTDAVLSRGLVYAVVYSCAVLGIILAMVLIRTVFRFGCRGGGAGGGGDFQAFGAAAGCAEFRGAQYESGCAPHCGQPAFAFLGSAYLAVLARRGGDGGAVDFGGASRARIGKTQLR